MKPGLPSLRQSEAGYTLVELSIILVIFSVLLIGSLTTFVFIGRIYYRGLYHSQVQDVANQIASSLTETIRTSGATITGAHEAVETIPPGGQATWVHNWYYWCVGNKQYAYEKVAQDKYSIRYVGEDDEDYGLVVTSTTSCHSDVATGFKRPDDPLNRPDSIELLRPNMHLINFDIQPVPDEQSNLFQIKIRIAYGGDTADATQLLDVFTFDDSSNPVGSEITGCRPNLIACSVFDLHVKVFRKFR